MNYLNTFFNGNCKDLMDKLPNDSVDVILTSPFYNTSRPANDERSLKELEARYDVHIDNMTDEDYIGFTVDLFNRYDKILKPNGTILYNLSYSAENSYLIWLTIAGIIQHTNFTTADTIVWKKKSALPNNTSSNKLTRITEYVFVFCRKDEHKTFKMNKKIKSVSARGQKYYENVFNFVEAKNNDGTCPYNKATFSSDLCEKLLDLYAQDNSVVFDSFMGTGTTAVACLRMGHSFIGAELSENQCKFAMDRLKDEFGDTKEYHLVSLGGATE